MIKFINRFFLVSVLPCIFFCCKKDEKLAVVSMTAATAELTASSTTLTLDSTNAANTNAITFNWPAVNYGAQVAVTYTLQLDSITDDFVNPVNVSLANSLTKSYSMAELNALAMSLGLAPGVPGQIHARVKADVNQSNGVASSVLSVISNVLVLNITPYSTKPVPKYPVPESLYLVGDASPGGWDNPVPTPSQEFTRIDDNTFGMVIDLIGGKQYLLIPENGDWSHKYAVTGTPDPMEGEFVLDANDNIPAPATSGLYKIIVDFVKATYTVTPATADEIPQNLFIVGDATAGGWDNPVPVPSQQFTRVSNGAFEISISLTGAKSYVFLPVNGDWSHKYGGNDKSGGELLKDGSVPDSNTPAPDASGNYIIGVNFFNNTYTVTQ